MIQTNNIDKSKNLINRLIRFDDQLIIQVYKILSKYTICDDNSHILQHSHIHVTQTEPYCQVSKKVKKKEDTTTISWV